MNEKYNGEPITMMFMEERGVCAIVIEEGTGDNLLDEDMDAGYIDYVNWTTHSMKMDYNMPIFVEWDGGMLLSKVYVQDMTVGEICEKVRSEAGFAADVKYMVYPSDEMAI